MSGTCRRPSATGMCREGAPAFRRGEDVKRSPDPWSRMRGLYDIVKFSDRLVCIVCICMHLGMHTEKAWKKPENPYI